MFFLRFSSSMGYSLNSSRLSRISPTGTADTNIFRVKFTWPGWKQARVWYPAKLWAERHFQAKETGFARGELVPVGRASEQQPDLDPINSLPRVWEVPPSLPTLSSRAGTHSRLSVEMPRETPAVNLVKKT